MKLTDQCSSKLSSIKKDRSPNAWWWLYRGWRHRHNIRKIRTCRHRQSFLWRFGVQTLFQCSPTHHLTVRPPSFTTIGDNTQSVFFQHRSKRLAVISSTKWGLIWNLKRVNFGISVSLSIFGWMLFQLRGFMFQAALKTELTVVQH